MKTCSKCETPKDESEFSKDRQNRDGLRPYCRVCASAMWKKAYAANPEYYKKRSTDWCKQNPLKRKRIQKHADLVSHYGISLAEHDRMLVQQEGKCAICSDTMAPPCVDHCHTTGNVRALLCSGCNTALGGLKDSSKLCFLAASYLQKFFS